MTRAKLQHTGDRWRHTHTSQARARRSSLVYSCTHHAMHLSRDLIDWWREHDPTRGNGVTSALLKPLKWRHGLIWISRQFFCVAPSVAVSSNHPAWQQTGRLKRWAKCAWLLTFLKTFDRKGLLGKWMDRTQVFITVSARVKLIPRENGNSQNPILPAKNARTCARVRLSFPYYRVRILWLVFQHHMFIR